MPNFLKADRIILLGESVADLLKILCLLGLIGDQLLGRELLNLVSLSGELRYLDYVLQSNLPWYLGGQSH